MTTIAIIGAVFVGIYLAWKLIVQPARVRQKQPDEWALGQWPVDPSRVRTREELVQAFDHLALLRGGRVARHWNHQTAADRLGTGGEAARITANRLARVYEQARYTPPQEPLPDAQLDLARRDLVALVGAGQP